MADVVDERLQPVEPGGDGELVLGGVAIARGYLNRPELTAERFIDGPKGRRYRTGDRVRVRADGEIEFLGRLDDQLSIRGFRVEPGEIAAALNSHPAIEASVAVGVGRSSSERRLVAYLVASDGERPHSDELASFLGDSLPDYMVPSSFVWLDQLPLTEHGKIDRDALPAPVDAARGGPAERRPLTRVEAGTAFVVAELLDIEEIGLNENFFLLGGRRSGSRRTRGRTASRTSSATRPAWSGVSPNRPISQHPATYAGQHASRTSPPNVASSGPACPGITLAEPSR